MMDFQKEDGIGEFAQKAESLLDTALPKEALKRLSEQQSSIMSGIQKLNPFSELEGNGTLDSDYATLCVLSYERAKYLKESLESLKKNANFPFELIIHDDGTNKERNNVYEILNDHCNHGATVISNPPGHNQGQGVALNRMFSMATGDPIVKLDADLLYYPGWLLEACRLLVTHQDIGLLGLLHYYHDPVDTHKTILHREDGYSIHSHILGSGFAVRRKCWEEIGPFSEHSEAFAEDWEFQNKVTESKKWNCSLPKEDLVKNPAMGYKTSTVNKTVGGEMPQIKKNPFIHANGSNLPLLSPPQ